MFQGRCNKLQNSKSDADTKQIRLFHKTQNDWTKQIKGKHQHGIIKEVLLLKSSQIPWKSHQEWQQVSQSC